MTHLTPPPPVCEACGETLAPTDGRFHPACIERLLGRLRRQRGASLVEYMMLLAFVAVLGIIGLRAVGPQVSGMFAAERLGLATTEATVPTQVLGVRVERPDRWNDCRLIPGADGAYPVCPE